MVAHAARLPIPLIVLALVAGCGTDPTPEPTPPDCVPSASVFKAVVQDHIDTHCGSCHGATPQFGAPNTLTGGYDSLIAGDEGERLIDRIAARMANKTMPPAGGEPVPHQVQDTVVEWASCGAKHPDHSIGLVVDRPVFSAPKSPPAGTETFDLKADQFAVAEDELDLYQCFTFEAPVKEDRFIQRIEAIIDDSRVVHHIVLLKDPKNAYALGLKKCKGMPADSQYLYAWAPGAAALQFPEGGARIKPGEHYIVQIHYNNGAGAKGVKDNSGIRVHHGPPKGTEYGMVAPGPLVFAIPPHSTFTATGHCKVKSDLTLLAGMPHMHENGTAFKQEIVRADGTREPLINLTGWSFEMQPFYHHPVTLKAGDRVETSCTWRNDTDDTVSMGTGTADEMCFNFMFVTPPPSEPYCNDFLLDPKAEAPYAPGTCAPTGASKTLPNHSQKLLFTGAPDIKGGDLGTARWELTGATLALPGLAKTYMNPDTSVVHSRGQAWSEGDTLTIDAAARILIELPNSQGIDSVDVLSVTGTVKPGKKAGEGTWEPSCGAKKPKNIRWTVDGDTLTVVLDKQFSQFTVPGIYTFKRAATDASK